VSAPQAKAPASPPKQGRPGRQNRRQLRRTVAIAVLSALVIAFAVTNLRRVRVDWLVGSGHAPLIVVIVVSLFVGAVLALFAERLARWRR
jgi:uncharacterized integral membrane protein